MTTKLCTLNSHQADCHQAVSSEHGHQAVCHQDMSTKHCRQAVNTKRCHQAVNTKRSRQAVSIKHGHQVVNTKQSSSCLSPSCEHLRTLPTSDMRTLRHSLPPTCGHDWTWSLGAMVWAISENGFSYYRGTIFYVSSV